MIDAIIVEGRDNVATAIHELRAGQTVITNRSDVISVVEAVPRGFKIARVDIGRHDHIIKYGVAVGVALSDIKRGEPVHVHNMGNLLTEWRWEA